MCGEICSWSTQHEQHENVNKDLILYHIIEYMILVFDSFFLYRVAHKIIETIKIIVLTFTVGMKITIQIVLYLQ